MEKLPNFGEKRTIDNIIVQLYLEECGRYTRYRWPIWQSGLGLYDVENIARPSQNSFKIVH